MSEVDRRDVFRVITLVKGNLEVKKYCLDLVKKLDGVDESLKQHMVGLLISYIGADRAILNLLYDLVPMDGKK
jgi:hypothetical protein